MKVYDINGKAGIQGAETKLIDYEENGAVAIYAIDVLQHISVISEFMDTCWFALKEAGFLLITVPLAPYRNAFDEDAKHYFTSGGFSNMVIDGKQWKVLNFNMSTVTKEDKNDPNTWLRTLTVKLQPIKEK